MIKITLITLILIVFLSFTSNADSNLIVQSENEQIVSIINLNNFSTISSNTTNKSVDLIYENYIVKLNPDISTLDNQTILHNLNLFTSDSYKFIWLCIIIVLVYCAYRFIKML